MSPHVAAVRTLTCGWLRKSKLPSAHPATEDPENSLPEPSWPIDIPPAEFSKNLTLELCFQSGGFRPEISTCRFHPADAF